MMMIATALLAAVLYGGGAAGEQGEAAAAPQSSAGRPRLLLLLVRQPLWLLGIVAQIGGFAAHAVALRSGPLATVQMMVAAELIVAGAIVRIWSGRPLRRAASRGRGADGRRGKRGVPGAALLGPRPRPPELCRGGGCGRRRHWVR